MTRFSYKVEYAYISDHPPYRHISPPVPKRSAFIDNFFADIQVVQIQSFAEIRHNALRLEE
jgi:hypothetical protein